jgi:hypothetical protein
MGGVHELLVGELDWDGVQGRLGLGQGDFSGEVVARAACVNDYFVWFGRGGT